MAGIEMAVEEMKARFDSEWVLFDRPESDEIEAIPGGGVLHHSKDEVYRKAAELRPPLCTAVYTG